MAITKRLNIKNRTYYFHDDLINLINFDPTLLNLHKKTLMDISIYYIEYITTKSISDYENITGINPLYLIINDVDGYIEEIDKNKYLSFASTDNIKEELKKYIKLWDEVKYHIQTINDDEFGEYGQGYMKIKFYSDDNLPLNKILKFSALTIIIRHVFEKDGKYYPSLLKLDEKSSTDINIYYIGYVTKKPGYNINSVNPFYLLIKL